jgi:hypothetical protein
MPKTKLPAEFQIKKYLTEKKTEILDFIDNHHRVLLQANPASGKTYFFMKLALDIINKKRSGRLIFCAPFLIISDQFIQALKDKRVDVDFKLWGESKRKHLEPTDKVITSTFQSFHHIMDELNEDDIVVVDETHALFYNYTKRKGGRQYYSRVVQNLYHVKAKIVLMSGTPNLALIPMLNLVHLKVSKVKEIKAKINIEFTNYKPVDIAKAYARDAIKNYGSSSLNIIYIKSIDYCIKIATMLENQGFRVEVITSKNKKSDTYNSIVEQSKIPKDIQFLVTTNVISTGANINNTNIGGALMINEFSPLEIKQFSKRFRKKLDIEVTVVNLIFIPQKKNLKMTQGMIQRQRKYLLDQLDHFKTVETDPQYDYNYKDNEGKEEGFVTPRGMTNLVLERLLIQESFYIDDAINLNEKSTLLAAALNKYDDISAKASFDYVKAKKMKRKVHQFVDEEKLEETIRVKTLVIIEHFHQNSNEYLSALLYNKNIDIGVKYTTRRITSGELKKEVQYSQKVIDNINDTLFQVKILPDFIRFREYFKTTPDFLSYLMSRNHKNQNILPYSLLVNGVLHGYMEQKRIQTAKFESQLKLQLKSDNKLGDLKPEIQVVILLLQKAFKYALGRDYITVAGLRELLEVDPQIVSILRKIDSPDKLPDDLFIKNGKIHFDSDNFIKALIQGLFITEKKRIGAVKKTGLKFIETPEKKLNNNNNRIYDSKNVSEIELNGHKYVLHWGTMRDAKVKQLNSYQGILNEFNAAEG